MTWGGVPELKRHHATVRQMLLLSNARLRTPDSELSLATDFLGARVMLRRPDFHLLVETYRALMVRHGKTRQRLRLLGPLF